jgi:hypothetical protein
MWESIKLFIAGGAAKDLQSLQFAFVNPLGSALSILIIVVVAAAAGLWYWSRLRRVKGRVRVTLTALRIGSVSLALVLFLDLSLVGEKERAIDQVIAVLFDNSKSMAISEAGPKTRAERALEVYANNDNAFEKNLAKQFHVVKYGFADTASRIDDPSRLKYDENESNLAASIESCIGDLGAANLAAIVLISDGIQQPAAVLDDARLKAFAVPIFAAGVGTTGSWSDLELAELSVKRTEFDKSPVVVTMRVEAANLKDESAIAEVLEDGQVVASQKLPIDGTAESYVAQVEFVPAQKGWTVCEARVRAAGTDERVSNILPTEKDRVVQNNSRSFVVDNRKKDFRILYLAGSPTWELKFFRRALEEDEELKLTSLIRVARAEKRFEFRGRNSSTANPLFQGVYQESADQPRYDESVFLRLGVDETQLASGYPSKAEELFAYHLVIWGAIEHDFFSQTQLELTRAFVERRGGTFLLMGGQRSFVEGGYRGSIIDQMLPVVLAQGSNTMPNINAATAGPYAISPTTDGTLNGAWSLDSSPDTNRALFEGLAGLFGLNAFALTRPGASVMAKVNAPGAEINGRVFFAQQRFGEGECAVLASENTWPWHTHTPESEQSRHQRLWRQITRSLVTNVPANIVRRDKLDSYTVGENIPLNFLVRNTEFLPQNGLRTTASVTLPTGEKHALPVDESIQEVGLYSAEFIPQTPGSYTIEFSSSNEKGEELQSFEEKIAVEPDGREFNRARSDEAFLKQLASVSGGEYAPIDELPKLAKSISALNRDVTQSDLERFHLWHWPPFLALFALLLTAEWYVRRTWGEP